MSGWREIMHKAAEFDPEGEPRLIAVDVLKKLKREDLIAMAAEEIAWRQREIVRASEVSAFRLMHSTESKFDPDRIKALLAITGTFRLGNGERVSWQHASVDQLRQRRDFLVKMRAGLDKTIERLNIAIDTLEASGVACIADLDARAA